MHRTYGQLHTSNMIILISYGIKATIGIKKNYNDKIMKIYFFFMVSNLADCLAVPLRVFSGIIHILRGRFSKAVKFGLGNAIKNYKERYENL